MAETTLDLPRFIRVQMKLAYHAAVEAIDLHTACMDSLVYDLGAIRPEALEQVEDAVFYLESRGLVARDPENPKLITLFDEDAIQRGLARLPEFEGLELADKVMLRNDWLNDRALEVDGVKVSFDMLVSLVNPNPKLMLRLEREGDRVIVHQHEVSGGTA